MSMTTAEVRIRKKQRPGLLIFQAPVAAVWLVLLPILIVLSPLIAIACLVGGVNPFRALSALWEICRALKGTLVEVEDYRQGVLVQIPEEII